MNERPPPDISLAVDAGVRWMSYADIAAARGISVASATRIARRKKWRRQPGNGATILVAVPLAELTRTERRTKTVRPGQSALSSPGQQAPSAPDIAAIVRGFETAIAALTARTEAADRRAEAAEGRADDERTRAAAAEAEAARLREAEAERDRLAGAVEALRAAIAARRGAGRLARIRAAWRGE